MIHFTIVNKIDRYTVYWRDVKRYDVSYASVCRLRKLTNKKKKYAWRNPCNTIITGVITHA